MPTNSKNARNFNLPIIQFERKNDATSQLRTGRGRIRAGVLLLVHVLLLAHLTHYWLKGRSVSPLEPSEAMYTLELGQVNAGAIFFGLAIISTAIFGRFFCGWGCHLVALQDLCGYLLRRAGLRPKPLRSRLLALVPFGLAFYMFVWPTVKRLWNSDRHPGFSNHLMTENFWYTFPGPVISLVTLLICGGLAVYLLGNKGFCTYACPYGAFFSIADRLALGRIRVTDACQHCGQCTAHCTSNVQVHSEVREFGMVVDPGCMKCMDCVSVCPNNALYFGLKDKPGARADETSRINAKASGTQKVYDFFLFEELSAFVLAGLTIFAFRGLYDTIPLLLSVALGVITAYLAIQLIRLPRCRDLRIQSIQIKRHGIMTPFGRSATVLGFVWFALIVHSAFVQYHRLQGRQHLTRVSVIWHELLTGDAQQSLTGDDIVNVDKALRSFHLSDRFGLMDVLDVKLGQAIGNLIKGDFGATEKFLRQAYAVDSSVTGEMLREFLVSQNRPADAAKVL